MIRLLVRRRADEAEHSYRLLLDEIPSPGAPLGVKFVLQVSIPVFLAPASGRPGRPLLQAWLERSSRSLLLVNGGQRYLRVAELQLQTATAPLPLQPLSSPYLLSGTQRRVPLADDALPLPAAGEALVLEAATSMGRIDVPVLVVP